MKKLISILIAAIMLFAFAACNAESGNNDGTSAAPNSTADTPASTAGSEITEAPKAHTIDDIPLETILNLFCDMNSELQLRSACEIRTLDKESIGYQIGYSEFNADFEEAVALSPMIMPNPFLLAVFRIAEGTDAKAYADDIASHANLNKWICVSADKAVGLGSGRTAVFFMSRNDLVEPLTEAFAKMCTADFNPEDYLKQPLKGITMDELYGNIAEKYSVSNYGFADGERSKADANSGYGFSAIDSKLFVDSVYDDGYLAATANEKEKSYLLAMFRLAEGVTVDDFLKALRAAEKTSELKGEENSAIVAYSDDVVAVFAGTGMYSYFTFDMRAEFMNEYRMSITSLVPLQY